MVFGRDSARGDHEPRIACKSSSTTFGSTKFNAVRITRRWGYADPYRTRRMYGPALPHLAGVGHLQEAWSGPPKLTLLCQFPVVGELSFVVT
jgi:hypothetical protein